MRACVLTPIVVAVFLTGCGARESTKPLAREPATTSRPATTTGPSGELIVAPGARVTLARGDVRTGQRVRCRGGGGAHVPPPGHGVWGEGGHSADGSAGSSIDIRTDPDVTVVIECG